MKSNLFRSISNALAESFPILPRIRKSFVGLLMFCILFIWIGLSKNNLTIPVTPVSLGQYNNRTVTAYRSGAVNIAGQFTITDRDLFERILLPNMSPDLDMFTLFFVAIASIIIIWIVPKLQQQNLFRKDISNAIRLLGYLIALHGVADFFRISLYTPRTIESLTNNEFTSHGVYPLTFYVELYFSMIVIALAGLYKRGIKLQQEQDLTI